MPDLPAVSGPEAIAAFRRAGFEVERTRGSHHVLKKKGHPVNLVVPVHGKKSIQRGLLRRLIRDAGLSVDGFIQLLGG